MISTSLSLGSQFKIRQGLSVSIKTLLDKKPKWSVFVKVASIMVKTPTYWYLWELRFQTFVSWIFVVAWRCSLVPLDNPWMFIQAGRYQGPLLLFCLAFGKSSIINNCRCLFWDSKGFFSRWLVWLTCFTSVLGLTIFLIPTVKVSVTESSHSTSLQENMKEKKRKGKYLPRDWRRQSLPCPLFGSYLKVLFKALRMQTYFVRLH